MITLNFEVFTFVVMRDMKNIRQTIRRSWLFCASVRPCFFMGDLLSSEGNEFRSRDLLLIQIIISMHEIVDMIPITER